MKRKVIGFIFALALVVPSIIIFSACGQKKSVESITIDVTNEEYEFNEGVLTFSYGEEVNIQKSDFEVTAKFDDASTEITENYSMILPEEFSQEVIPVGDDYIITFVYGESDISATVRVKIQKIEIAKPTFTNNIICVAEYNGDAHSIATLIANSSNTHLVALNNLISMGMVELKTIPNDNNSKLTAVDAGTYTIQIVPKSNFAWVGQDSSVIDCSWIISRKIVAAPTLVQTNFEYKHEWNAGDNKFIGVTQRPEIDTEFSLLFDIINNGGSNLGSYNVKVSIKDEYKNNYILSTGGTSVELSWGITPMRVVKPTINTTIEYSGQVVKPLNLSGENVNLLAVNLSAENPTEVGTYTYTIGFNDLKIENKNNYIWEGETTNAAITLQYIIIAAGIGVEDMNWAIPFSVEYAQAGYNNEISSISSSYITYKNYYKSTENGTYSLITEKPNSIGYYKTVAEIDSNHYLYLNADGNKTPITTGLEKEWRIVPKVLATPTLEAATFNFTHTWDDVGNKYVGIAQLPTISNSYQHGELLNVSQNTHQSGVGLHQFVIETINNNYTFSSGRTVSLDWRITPMEINKPTLDNTNYEYNGEVIDPLTINSDISNLLTVSLSEENPTNVGQYTYTIDFNSNNIDNKANYKWVGEENNNSYTLTYIITPKELVESDFGWNYTSAFEYTGNACVVELNSDYGEYVDIYYTNNTKTDVGEYRASAEIRVNSENYYITGDSLEINLEWSIAPKELTAEDFAEWDYEEPFVYSGDLFIVSLVSDLIDSNIVSVEYVDNEQSEAGIYTAIAIITVNNENYYIAGDSLEISLDWEINPKVITEVDFAEWDYEEPFVYSGDLFIVSLVSDLIDGNIVSVEYVDNEQSESGMYTAIAIITFVDSNNTNYTMLNDAIEVYLEWEIQ